MKHTIHSVRKGLEGIYDYANHWALWLAAFVVGGVFAALGYAGFKHSVPTYPDFVVGYITLNASGKAGEYAAAFGLVIGTIVAFHVLAYLMKRLAAQAGDAVTEAYYARIIVAVTPAILWGTTSLWPQAERLSFYWIAVTLVVLTVFGATLALRRPQVWLAADNMRLFSILEGAILLPIAGALAVHGIAMIGNRVGVPPSLFTYPQNLYQTVVAAAVLGAAAVAAIGLMVRSADRAVAIIRTLLVAAQIPAFGVLLIMVPVPLWTPDVGVHYEEPIRTSNWIAIAVLATIGITDLARLWNKARRTSASPALVVSALTLIAFIAYSRTPAPAPIPIALDDYHAAETFAPWWSMVKHGMLPMWDFAPVRGLINYEAGALAALFTNDTAAGLIGTKQIHFLFILLIVFPLLSLAVGKWWAFFILSFAALDEGPGGIDAIMAGGFALLCWAWINLSRVAWLTTWLLVGVAAVLIAPGQGGVLVLATMPGGLWQFYYAFREDRQRVLRTGALILSFAVILLLATPLGLMVLGAIRYGTEQSAVNGVANGIPWRYGTQSFINSWIFEILRFSWLGVSAIALVLTLKIWASKASPSKTWTSTQSEYRSVALFAGVTVVLLCVIFVTRSVVRLDAGASGRPGWATIWALTLLLPILLHYALSGHARIKALITSVAIGGMLTANFGLLGLEFTYDRPFMLRTKATPDQYLARGAELGMPNLGNVILEKPHAVRLETVNSQLQKLLTPTETFLDMTNNGAQYFYFNRPPPSESTAVYNLVTSAQQLRTVKSLLEKNVPVALIGPHTVPIDGFFPNLRSHLVYRHLMLNYVPVTIDGFDYMIKAERLAQVRAAFGVVSLSTKDVMVMLDRNYPVMDFGNMPRSFGRSVDELEERMRKVHDLDVSSAEVFGGQRTVSGLFAPEGNSLSLRFNLRALNVAGRNAGILQFNLTCESKPRKWAMSASWTSPEHGQGAVQFGGRNGTHIVPLDAIPRWLLSPSLDTLMLTISDSDCTELRLSDVKLLQRIDADKIDQLAAAQ